MKNMGDGRRKTRVEKEVQNVVSNFIIHHMKSDIPGLVTVSRVQMPADFRNAEVFVTYYDPTQAENSKFDVVDVLNSWASDIQDEIASQLKMRYCPKVRFTYDQTTEHILKIENILSNLSPGQKVHADDEESD
jgi:ribosome-binding factor A